MPIEISLFARLAALLGLLTPLLPSIADAQSFALPRLTDWKSSRAELPLPRGPFTADRSLPYGFGAEVLFDAGCPSKECSGADWRLEYALAFAQVSGLSCGGQSDLRARVRVEPEASLYASKGDSSWAEASASRISKAQPMTQLATGSASRQKRFRRKASLGINLFRGAFIEVGYVLRRFSFVDYDLPQSVPLPAWLPRSVFASGLFVNVGYQMQIVLPDPPMAH